MCATMCTYRSRAGGKVKACLECSKSVQVRVRPRPCISIQPPSSIMRAVGSTGGPEGQDSPGRHLSSSQPHSQNTSPSLDPVFPSLTPSSLTTSTSDAQLGAAHQTGTKPEAEPTESDSLAVRAALAALGFYRNVMSPLMPSSCRYQPTCSQYSIDAYKKFGAWKGTVLTAWRIMRCNPFGSSGFDPPVWPPVGWLGALYAEGSWEYAPQVTVVVGTLLFAYVANELITEVAAIL